MAFERIWTSLRARRSSALRVVGFSIPGRAEFEPPLPMTADDLQAWRWLGSELRGYLSVARFCAMHMFDRRYWNCALPGMYKSFARFTIWSFACRIALSAILVALPLAHYSRYLAADRSWSIGATFWHVFVCAMLTLSLIGPWRWLLAWLFVPCSFVYTLAHYRFCSARGFDRTPIPVLMNNRHLLVSYGALGGLWLVWQTGQHGRGVLSWCIIAACVSMSTLLAKSALDLIPRRLFQGAYPVIFTRE